MTTIQLATTLFVNRASIEPNFHDLYLKFLEKASSRPLTREIVQATYENCKVRFCNLFFGVFKDNHLWVTEVYISFGDVTGSFRI